MKVFVYTMDEDGELSKSWCSDFPATDPESACMLAMAKHLQNYVSDFGVDFRDMKVQIFPKNGSIELTMYDGDDEEGEKAGMYFSTIQSTWEGTA